MERAASRPRIELCHGESTEIEFQIATQAFRSIWREPTGEERAKVWSFLIDCHPFCASYQASTASILP